MQNENFLPVEAVHPCLLLPRVGPRLSGPSNNLAAAHNLVPAAVRHLPLGYHLAATSKADKAAPHAQTVSEYEHNGYDNGSGQAERGEAARLRL